MNITMLNTPGDDSSIGGDMSGTSLFIMLLFPKNLAPSFLVDYFLVKLDLPFYIILLFIFFYLCLCSYFTLDSLVGNNTL